MLRASSIFANALLGAVLAAVAPLVALSANGATAAPGSAAALGSAPRPSDVRVLAAPADSDPARTIDALERSGYRVHVVLLPRTYYVTAVGEAGALPPAVRSLGTRDAIGALAALESDPARPPGMTEPPAAGAAEDPFAGRADAMPPVRDDATAAARDRMAQSVIKLPSGLAEGTGGNDTSELMIGRVAVPIFFPESDGTIDPNHYDWTPALRDSVVRSAVRGFIKWSLFAASRNIPLSFFIEIHADLSTRYEPIDRSIGQEDLWIQDVLTTLVGYRGATETMAYEVANAARARLNAHWAALAFAVQNDSSSTGTFPDGYIAHAKLGGPWFVIPVNNLKTQSARLDFYFEHEVTHQFWALDEFPANNAWWSCPLTTGYFNRPNTNASVPTDGYCGVPTVHCVMKGNYPDDFCSYTTAQVGWADLDQNGILDLYETHPLVRPDSTQYRTGVGLPLTLSGEAGEVAIPNRNPYWFGAGDSISIATIDSIQYQLDGAAWVSIPCADGRFDSGKEPFTLILPPLAPGSHGVDWRAWNSNGKTAPVPSTTLITISGTAGSIGGPGGASAPQAPRLTAAPTPARGHVRLLLRAPPDRAGTASVLDVAGRVVRSWRIAIPAEGLLAWEWDGRREGGGWASAGLYFVVVRTGTVTLTERVVLLR